MTKLADLPPSTRNKGNTSPIKTKTHIYKKKTDGVQFGLTHQYQVKGEILQMKSQEVG